MACRGTRRRQTLLPTVLSGALPRIVEAQRALKGFLVQMDPLDLHAVSKAIHRVSPAVSEVGESEVHVELRSVAVVVSIQQQVGLKAGVSCKGTTAAQRNGQIGEIVTRLDAILTNLDLADQRSIDQSIARGAVDVVVVARQR